MSFREIIENVIPKLQALVYFDTLSLYIVAKDKLVNRAVFVNAGSQSEEVDDSTNDQARPDESAALRDVLRPTEAAWKF